MLMIGHCVCSLYRQMLTNQSWVDAGKSDLVLCEDEQCSHVFAEFLRFVTIKCELSELYNKLH